MLRPILITIICCCSLTLCAQISISENHRYLLRNGKPFFRLGDTAWELFHRLNKEQADQYLERRAEQGFTVYRP